MVIGLAGIRPIAVGAAFEQVGESRIGGIAAMCGIEDELLFGAGQRDVKQTQAFCHFFVGKVDAVFFVKLRFGKQLGGVGGGVEDLPIGGLHIFRVPNERAINQRILQTFGCMHGDDFDQCFVAFKP